MYDRLLQREELCWNTNIGHKELGKNCNILCLIWEWHIPRIQGSWSLTSTMELVRGWKILSELWASKTSFETRQIILNTFLWMNNNIHCLHLDACQRQTPSRKMIKESDTNPLKKKNPITVNANYQEHTHLNEPEFESCTIIQMLSTAGLRPLTVILCDEQHKPSFLLWKLEPGGRFLSSFILTDLPVVFL